MDAIVGEVDICEYEGKGYMANEKFTAKDGCNSCTCTIEGKVECSENACDPVLGCDEKYGCEDAGGPYADAGGLYAPDGASGHVCDAKYPCYDAGTSDPQGYCKYNGSSYKLGEAFRAEDGCSFCYCDMFGNVDCEKKVCYEPDGAVAPGTCEYAFRTFKAGEWFMGSNCSNCECTERGVVECTVGGCNNDAGVNDGGYSDAGSAPAGYCQYQGNKYRVGEGFGRGDNCNKCTCVSDGLIECSSLSCAAPPGCLLGNELIQIGKAVICDDGCNTCTCQMDGKFSRTERACSALPAIGKCGASAGALYVPAALVYLNADALAVSESRCVNGQTNDFSLCYEDLVSTMGNLTTVFAVPGSGTRACSGTERVYSLIPLRDDYLATFPGRSGGKIVLRGTGDDLFYQFGM